MAESFEYKAEMKQLLHLIVHSLYTHREIFLRELISNASDALNKVRFLKLTEKDLRDQEAPLRIDISVDKENNTLTVRDSGIGMTRDDLIEQIGTVASSGTLAFLEEMKRNERPLDGQIIGQFGVGFYASFMVAEEVVIETRHCDKDSVGLRWVSDGTGTYTIEEIDVPNRGTTVTLKLKQDARQFSEETRVKHIVRKYSNFVDYPIYLGDEQINTVKALWRKNRSELDEKEIEEFYKFISNDYEAPLGHLHLKLEGRVNFSALLFIPAHAPMELFRLEEHRNLHLYASSVFIQDDCKELLPEYLRFVRGVVDTEDLPLNVSREVTQSSPVMVRISKILTGKVLGLLEEWAKEDEEKYTTFDRQFGGVLKLGIGTDSAHRDRLIELARFETTHTGADERASLAEVVDRMPEDQEVIYYLSGDNRDSVLRNPSLEYFKSKDIEVLLLTEPIDVFTAPAIGTYREKSLQSIEKADLDLGSTAAEEETEESTLDNTVSERLVLRFKDVLGERVADVRISRRLVESAATLVVGEGGVDRQMERMMRMMNQDFEGAKKVLEINPAHPLVAGVAANLDSPDKTDTVRDVVLQIYEGALLIDGSMEKPTAFVERMNKLLAGVLDNS